MAEPALDFPNRRLMEGYAEKYRLALPERQRAVRVGDLTGKLSGSSIEYQDRKDYVPGDDTRHIDWRAYARNDRLTIKLYRQEISPIVDLVVDTSESMAVTGAKAARRMDLAYLFWLLARRLGGSVRTYALGERLRRAADPMQFLNWPPTALVDPLPLLAGSPVARPGGIKILISDFLFPFEPSRLIQLLGGADRIIAVQVLSAFEADPGHEGDLRLEDAETNETIDVALDRPTIEGYRKRLERLQGDLRSALRSREGAMAVAREDEPPGKMILALHRAGIVEA